MAPRTPLLRPDRFFAERDVHGTRLAVVATALVLSALGTLWGVIWILTERFDGTVTVDNPERPSETFCRNAPESMAEGCDAPAEIERNIDAVLWEASGEFLVPVLIAFPIVLLVIGALLHVGSSMLGGDNGIAESFAVALWGLVPSVFSFVVMLALIALVVDPVTVTPDSTPSVLEERLRADLRPVMQWQPFVTGVTALWGGIIWRFGMEVERGLSRGEAIGLAGSVALLFWLFSFV